MSDDNTPPEFDGPVLGMPVAEVVAYLTEVSAYNQMIAERLNAQIAALGEALEAAANAQTLADNADTSSDNG